MIFTIADKAIHKGNYFSIYEYSLKSEHLDVSLSYVQGNGTFLTRYINGEITLNQKLTLADLKENIIRTLALELYYLSSRDPDAKELKFDLSILKREVI